MKPLRTALALPTPAHALFCAADVPQPAVVIGAAAAAAGAAAVIDAAGAAAVASAGSVDGAAVTALRTKAQRQEVMCT